MDFLIYIYIFVYLYIYLFVLKVYLSKEVSGCHDRTLIVSIIYDGSRDLWHISKEKLYNCVINHQFVL